MVSRSSSGDRGVPAERDQAADPDERAQCRPGRPERLPAQQGRSGSPRRGVGSRLDGVPALGDLGPEDKFLNLFAGIAKLLPVIYLAGAAARFQPVYVGDVADAIALALDDDSTIGQRYPLCGPQGIHAARAGRLCGRPRRVPAAHRRPAFQPGDRAGLGPRTSAGQGDDAG